MKQIEKKVLNEIISECKITYKEKPLVHDIGDILPFLYYYGEHEFCKKQIDLTVDIIGKEWVYRRRNIVKISDQIDMLLGFIELYRQSHNKEILSYSEKIFRSIYTHFVRKGKIFQYSKPKFYPFPTNISEYGAMIIELGIDLFDFTNDKYYLEKVQELTDQIITDNFFVENGFYYGGYYVLGISIRGISSPLLKRNWYQKTSKSDNFISGLISLYEINKNKDILFGLEHYFSSANEKLLKDGQFHSSMHLPTGNLNEPHLFSSFLMIDRLCHAYHVFKNKEYLEFAKIIANSWLNKQGKTGLFPFYFNSKDSWLDSETDFSISLLRLHELSGNDIYKKSAERCYEGMLKYNWRYETVDIDSGDKKKPLLYTSPDSRDDYQSDPKFKALSLKVMIAINSEKGIFEDKCLFKILRDR